MSAPFRTGDVVRHKPTGETWTVAYGDCYEIVCCGWPESWAPVTEVEMVRAATDSEHWDLVRRVANSPNSSRQRSCWYLLEQHLLSQCSAMMHL